MPDPDSDRDCDREDDPLGVSVCVEVELPDGVLLELGVEDPLPEPLRVTVALGVLLDVVDAVPDVLGVRVAEGL